MPLVTINEASKWATNYLEKSVSPTNISYLVQYGKVRKLGENGSTMVDLNDLKKYYESWNGKREIDWKKKLGSDLNWTLSFDGSVEEARFIGWDSLTNIAFFRIEVSDAPAIALADSDSARLGKKLIAIAHGDEARQNRFLTGTLDAFDATFNLSGKTVASTEKWEGVFRMNTPLGVDFVGSPVIQYNGEMLGIIGTLVIDNAPETFIIPAKAIRQSLDFVLSEEGSKNR
jgi:hypothetical protein